MRCDECQKVLADMVRAHDAFTARLRAGTPKAPAEKHFRAIDRARAFVAEGCDGA